MNLNNLRKDAAVNKLFVLINPAEIRKTGYIISLKHYTIFYRHVTTKNGHM